MVKKSLLSGICIHNSYPTIYVGWQDSSNDQSCQPVFFQFRLITIREQTLYTFENIDYLLVGRSHPPSWSL